MDKGEQMTDSVGISIGGNAAPVPVEFVPAIIALAKAVKANAASASTTPMSDLAKTRKELLEVANRLEVLTRRNRFASDVTKELHELRAKVLDVTPEYEHNAAKNQTLSMVDLITQRSIGVCSDCRMLVYMRKDGSAYRHRLRMGAEDQVCEGSGYPVKFVRVEHG
jgi:hypothetical protein